MIYETFYILNSILNGLIRTHKWPVPKVSGFIAKLVRASHRYREVTGSNPVKVLSFSGFYTQLLKLRSYNYDDHSLHEGTCWKSSNERRGGGSLRITTLKHTIKMFNDAYYKWTAIIYYSCILPKDVLSGAVLWSRLLFGSHWTHKQCNENVHWSMDTPEVTELCFLLRVSATWKGTKLITRNQDIKSGHSDFAVGSQKSF